MAESEDLTRKKSVRRAHRASATRTMTQAKDMIEGREEATVARLKQKKQTLEAKMEVLNTLDEEITGMVAIDALDDEIQRADEVREEIGLVIMDLDAALEALKAPTDTSTSTRAPTERGTEAEAGRPTTHRTVEDTEPPTGRSTPPTADPETGTAVGGPTHAADTRGHTPNVRLPKLSIKKFNGDLVKWTTFWDTFESAVHTNSSLSSIDKFNYLNSLLESEAAGAISGLTLTAANYDEAVTTLKRRFGNKQLIVSRHMDLLLNLEAVTSQHNLKGLRHLFDVVESNVWGLRALGVPADTYGGLLSSILMGKLPAELRLIVSRELRERDWDFTSLMGVVEREVEARELSVRTHPSQQPRKNPGRGPPTALTLVTGASPTTNCVYCGQAHSSSSCQAVTSIDERKTILRSAGRCFMCLRRGHILKKCRATVNCNRCQGRHHVSICSSPKSGNQLGSGQGPTNKPQQANNSSTGVTPTTTNYVSSCTPILLQTAMATVCDASIPKPTATLEIRAILDAGSQRSYVTTRVQEKLSMRRVRSESMVIKTFGSDKEDRRVCDVSELGILTKSGKIVKLPVVVVPHICDPLQIQPVSAAKQVYDHLTGLDLADVADSTHNLEIDVLIGSDEYWKLVTGRVIKGSCGPTAIETLLGWVLSGPVNGTTDGETVVSIVATPSSHILRVDAATEDDKLEAGLQRFWDLESLGIGKNERSVQETFTQQISMKEGRYEVHLPWKESHSLLPDNYDLCRKRLTGLLQKLKKSPDLLRDYDVMIQDQLRKGIVEPVTDPDQFVEGKLHYLPHHAVVRTDKQTTKLRIVYDASAKMSGPSLNECLHTGPKFEQSILDILLRFRLHKVALVGDVEKAFLMVSVAPEDRDVLRFLWVDSVDSPHAKIMEFRFTRVVFGVSSSPFLLNATIDHHIKKFQSVDQPFVEKFRRSMYVDDLTSGSFDVVSAYEFYIKSKSRLAEAGFNLRKFSTNSEELRQRIHDNEQRLHQGGTGKSSDSSLCCPQAKPVECMVLGVKWDVNGDQLIFDVSDVGRAMNETTPTKRNVVSLATRFFDPLGVMSPITVRFKLLFQQLCGSKTDWDEPLSGKSLSDWKALSSDLQEAKPIAMSRCCVAGMSERVKSFSLQGFCDASQRAYAAMVYIQVEFESGKLSYLLCTKTRIAPTKALTIPRLELLSALLLARLMSSVRHAVQDEVELSEPTCYTDSQVALCWIRGQDKDWKQFVQNRVTEIRQLVPIQSWKHCPGVQNPADIPSRGASIAELQEKSDLWLHGPAWLSTPGGSGTTEDTGNIPEECLPEMKTKEREKLTLNMHASCEPDVIRCQDYSDLKRLLRVTSIVLKFIKALKASRKSALRLSSEVDIVVTSEDIEAALVHWVRVSQLSLTRMLKFPIWKQQFGLFQDDQGLWRCQGRLANSDVAVTAKYPMLLNKTHHLTHLIVWDCHERVMHSGVKATLAELRSRYWIVGGRQLVKKILHSCVLCRRFQAKPFRPPLAPPLPAFRVQESPPFYHTGLDFAGPLYVRDTVAADSRKVWICLFTCSVTRAVHLDIVPDMTSQAFIRCFKRFTSRRGFPVRIVSDNAKTFKSARRMIAESLNSPDVKRYLSHVDVNWTFNLEKAPWWGGMFERMVQSVKRCLRKTIGSAKLTYDELLTSVTEVEMILNSRPLTYQSSDDVEEALTPSHLLIGRRVLTLADPAAVDEFDPSAEHTRDDLTRRMKHLSQTVGDFWKRWRSEYLLELRHAHRWFQTPRGNSHPIAIGDVVIVHDENRPRGLWKLGQVQSLIPSTDGRTRGAIVRIRSGERHSNLRRPIQLLYPLEVKGNVDSSSPEPVNDMEDATHEDTTCVTADMPARPQRRAAVESRERVKTWTNELEYDSD